MHLFLVGVNHKTAPLHIREHVSRHLVTLQRRLTALRRMKAVDEWCILSTCNRVELYGVSSVKPDLERLLARFTVDTEGPSPDEMKSASYCHFGEQAITHLMEVVAGLDSMVLGEGQIGGQTRSAFKKGQADKTIGPVLTRLFSNAIRWAKKAREQSGLSRFAVDVAYAAVELARRIFGTLAGLPVAIVGSGKMGQLALSHLQKAGTGQVTVLNRTLENAQSLADTVGGRARSLSELDKGLQEADVVISSTGACEPIMTKNLVERAMAERVGKPLFILDVAVPRDVEAAVSELANVYLYNVDDLQGVVDANLQKREQAAAKAHSVIAEGVIEFGKWLHGRRLSPLLSSLEEQVESVVQLEYDRLKNRVDSNEEDKERIRESLRRVAKKVIHPCLSRLRRLGGETDEESETLVSLATTLFSLEGKEASDNDPEE